MLVELLSVGLIGLAVKSAIENPENAAKYIQKAQEKQAQQQAQQQARYNSRLSSLQSQLNAIPAERDRIGYLYNSGQISSADYNYRYKQLEARRYELEQQIRSLGG